MFDRKSLVLKTVCYGLIGATLLLASNFVSGGGTGTVTTVAINGTINKISTSGSCLITTSGTCTISLPSNIHGVTGLTPGGDLVLTQNGVAAESFIENGAVVNTLYCSAGKCGIGTASPGTALDVNGTFTARSTSDAVFGNGTTGGVKIGDSNITKTSGGVFLFGSGVQAGGPLTTTYVKGGFTDSVARFGADATGKPLEFFFNGGSIAALTMYTNGTVAVGPSNTSSSLAGTMSVLDATASTGATAVNVGWDGGAFTTGHTSATTTQLTIVAGQAQSTTPLLELLYDSTHTASLNTASDGSLVLASSGNSLQLSANTIRLSFGGGGGALTFQGDTGNLYLRNASNNADANINAGIFGWNNFDTGLSRISAGLIGVGTGAQGSTAGSLQLTGIQNLNPVAVGSLPSCASGTLGKRQEVNDATLSTPGSTAVGSGTFTIAVQCTFNSTGSAYTWIID